MAVLFCAGLVASCVPAFGQVDMFGAPRFIWMTAVGNQTFTNNGSSLTVSNGPVDIHGYDGIATVLLTTTNVTGAGSLIYARLEGSTDATNWTLLNNVCATNTVYSYNITNLNYPSSQAQATNYYLLPGTVTNQTGTGAAVPGFAGQYVNPAPFTNYGILCTNVTGGAFLLGFNVADAPRYIHLVATTTGTQSTWFMGAVVIARKNSGNVFY